jgi:hypothetical protein
VRVRRSIFDRVPKKWSGAPDSANIFSEISIIVVVKKGKVGVCLFGLHKFGRC